MRVSLAPRARLALLPGALLAVVPFAASAQPTLAPTVVTATRTESRADALVSDVAVIDRAAIERAGARTLPELLARQGGLQMAGNGPRGKPASVFIRGAENRHTLLLVDGVRVGSASAGTPTWDTVPLEMIERIEILKGPGSALYGSDAVGGVVQIFTRQGREGLHPHAALTLGSGRHRTAAAGVAGGAGGLRYTLNVQRLRERGGSATNPQVPFGNFHPDADPFEQDTLQASVRQELAAGWAADAGVLYSDGKTWVDDGPGFDAVSAIRGLTAHAGVKGKPVAGWQTSLRVSQGTDTNNSIVASWPGAFRTGERQWSWQNDIETPLGVVLAGFEQRRQQVRSTTAYDVTERTIDSAFAGVHGSAGRHSWQANVRRDRNSQFGGATTGFAGYGLQLGAGWRASVSHGTSFVAPSFNQLYFPGFGNPDLLPERGRNTDLALTWAGAGHEVKLVRYANRIRGFMTNTTLPQNIDQARIDGWSLGYAGSAGPVELRGALDLLRPRNVANGNQLPRRARQQLTLGADWAQGDWRFGGNLLAVGRRWDDAANTARLAGYATLDLHADWQLAPDWSLQARVNNLTDRDYETALGYEQPGRQLLFTLRWQPK